MFAKTLILSLSGLAFFLPPPYRQFAGLTLGSFLLLATMPSWCRRHVRKVGSYHHELSHAVVGWFGDHKISRFFVHPSGIGSSPRNIGRSRMLTSTGYIGTIIVGLVYLAQSAGNAGLITVLYLFALLYGVSTFKAGDFHTASLGLAVAGIVGLMVHLAPDSFATKLILNLLGVALVYHGLRSLWEVHTPLPQLAPEE